MGYRFGIDYAGNANFLSVGSNQPVSAELESWNGMANVFLDLAPLSGIDLGRFQPYIGAGVGVARNSLGEMTYRFPDNPKRHKISVTPDGDRTNVAYRLAIGTGYALTETIALDLSAYYIDLGKVGTDAGRMAMNTIPAGIPIDETEADLRAFGFSIGLRYDF
ncbi:MAG: porin family protein [Sphingobacteriia bacterium]|nr:porin family protein [Sphingobacteriia bacterium]